MIKPIKISVSAILFISMGFLALPLAAQQQSGESSKSGDKQPETKVYDFEGDNVTGELVKPTGENVKAQQHGKTSSLIDIRSDFVPEMLETVEEF